MPRDLGSRTGIANAYGSGWNGSTKYATEDAVYDKVQQIESVVTLTDAANVSIDWQPGKVHKLTTANSRTINAPTNPQSGKPIVIAIKNSGGSAITPIFTTGSSGAFRFGSDLTAAASIAAGKTTYYTVIYNSDDARCDVVAEMKGY